MIVRSKPTFWALLEIFRLSILPQIVYRLISIFLFSCAVVEFEAQFPRVLHTWNAAPFTLLGVAYAFFGLDALGDELEQPFGTSINALPLDAMTRTVEISLLEALGEINLPEPLLPVDYLLR